MGVKLTKNEQKKQKDALKQFQRYLPTLQLKQQQLQAVIRESEQEIARMKEEQARAKASLSGWIAVYGENASFPQEKSIGNLVKVDRIEKDRGNIAGVEVPVFKSLVFRPVEDNFSEITIEMVRTAEDYNIQGVDDSGETIYGRYIPLDSFEYTLYTLTNLVNDINPNGSLDRVGVWSHPGLLMAVNGEEIRVGKSGLWEIDGILPIESLGIVAVDYKDQFSIDFMYEN